MRNKVKAARPKWSRALELETSAMTISRWENGQAECICPALQPRSKLRSWPGTA